MATVGLYGSSSSGVVAAASGSESTGLYGNNVSFGGSYFEWFIFQQSDLQPATPTGGSWDFSTNTGVAPAGWSSVPFANPTNKIWVSIALVNSKNSSTLTWSAPGLFSYSSGLPILSGNGSPSAGTGQSDQLYIQLDTTPQTIWFKETGTWTRLTGSSLYVDLTSNQTIAGTKTFSSQIQGSVSGTAGNVTGIVGIANGGTGATTAPAARTALGAAASGANSDITSMSGITGAISTPDNIQFDTTATATVAVGNLRWNTTTNTMSFGIIDGTDEVSIGEQMFAYVTNADSVTITRGQPVYLFGATGNRASVKLAANTSDATSAKTLGLASQDIAPNNSGFVITQGVLDKVNTNGFAAGATLYLGATPGTLTATKPQAPNHLVYIGVVERANAGNGQIYVKPQNGYELDEIHDVQIISPINGNTLIYDASTSLWKNALLTAGTGITITNGPGSITISAPENGTVTSVNVSGGTTGLTTSGGPITSSGTITLAGTLAIANGGTGQTTANAAFNALAPSQTGNAGKYLTTDGTNTSWATNPLGTVTSVDASGGTTGLTFSGGPVTTSGTLTLAGTLGLANGGTGSTTAAGARTSLGLGTIATQNSNSVSITGGTITGITDLAIADGGTGASTAADARTNLGVTATGQDTTYAYRANNLSDLANAATARTNLGLGTIATQNANSVAITGGTVNGTSIGATTTSTGAFTSLTASLDSSFTSTGALAISKGTTAQQPGTPVTGMIRYNTTTNQFEGYGGASPSWSSIGGGAVISNDTATGTNLFPLFANATSGTASNIYTSNAKLLYKPSTGELQSSALVATNGIVVSSATVAVDYTIPTGSNAMSTGPVTIATGVAVTVPSGSVWTVI